jgi:thiamine-phosphate diphosphorylase
MTAKRRPDPTPLLPGLIVLTDVAAARGRPLTEVVAAAVDGGARAVLLREKHLPRHERAALAEALRQVLAPVAGLLLVASDASIPSDGVHLASAEAVPLPRPPLLGRSCHTSADVARAADEGCNYVTLSPVFLTGSKPGYGPPLGLASLAGLPLPVWALGGVTAGNAASCVRSGAAGVAVMGAVMGAREPAAVTAGICRSLQAAAA